MVHPPQDVLKILTGTVPNPIEAGGTPELPKLPELPLGELEEKLKEIPGVGEVLEKLTSIAQKAPSCNWEQHWSDKDD